MKFLAVFCFLSAVVLEAVVSQGVPTRSCPPGEHSVLYCPQVLEATCDLPQRPNPVGACGKADCFCNTGTIRSRQGGNCIDPLDC